MAWFDDLPQKREDALIEAARAKGVGIYPVSALFVGFVIRDGRSRRWEGALLIAVYGAFVVWFLAAGDR